MALPDQIRKQTEAVQKLYDDLVEDTSDPSAAPPPVVPDANSVEGSDPPASASEPPPAGAPPAEDFEQKYRSLQGMFNAEVPRLQSIVKDQQTRLSQMENLMASLSTVPTAPAAPAQSLVTDDDVAAYGDSIDMMRKVSREELNPVLAKMATLETALNNLATSMNTSILPQVRQVAQQQALSAEDRFWSDLQREVPDWQQVNNDGDFKSWLLTVDPLTGVTRQTYLEQAQKQLDVNRVIAFFRAYAAASGKHLAAATPPAQPARSASELERQIAPGRSRAGAPPVNPNAKVYSPADITKFYDDVRKGLYKGREAERNQFEVDLFSARKEGRIVANA